jgi:hypothetical protein
MASARSGPSTVSGKAEQAGDSASLEIVARAGLIAYGVVHLLVGWLAMKIAWSASDSNEVVDPLTVDWVDPDRCGRRCAARR